MVNGGKKNQSTETTKQLKWLVLFCICTRFFHLWFFHLSLLSWFSSFNVSSLFLFCLLLQLCCGGFIIFHATHMSLICFSCMLIALCMRAIEEEPLRSFQVTPAAAKHGDVRVSLEPYVCQKSTCCPDVLCTVSLISLVTVIDTVSKRRTTFLEIVFCCCGLWLRAQAQRLRVLGFLTTKKAYLTSVWISNELWYLLFFCLTLLLYIVLLNWRIILRPGFSHRRWKYADYLSLIECLCVGAACWYFSFLNLDLISGINYDRYSLR